MGRNMTAIRAGAVTIKIPDTLERIIKDLLERGPSNIAKVLKDEVQEIADGARDKWLVRAEGSLNSRGKFEADTKIGLGGNNLIIVGYVANMAPYANAIKVGRKSNTSLPFGTHLATELIKKPFQKRKKAVAEKITKEIKKLH